MALRAAFIPYCGLAPVPGGLVWNTDPVLASALVLVGVLMIRGARRAPGEPGSVQALACAGWLSLGLALVSPLCNLGVALFSARVAQHVVLALVAAPLLVAGRADIALLRTLGLHPRDVTGRREMLIAPFAYAGVLWFWHAPPLYDATLTNNGAYWAMHLTTIAAALSLWRAILRAPTPGGGVAVSFTTGLQMGFLGAGLTLVPRTLYGAHVLTAPAWGYSPLEDQQLGGLIMWVPGAVLLTAHAVLALGLTLKRMERANTARA